MSTPVSAAPRPRYGGPSAGCSPLPLRHKLNMTKASSGHRGFEFLHRLFALTTRVVAAAAFFFFFLFLLPRAASEPRADVSSASADQQGLQFMLSLYRRAADADGRPREPRMFGCNTVRFVRASEFRRSRFPAPSAQRYTYALDFGLTIFPKERLVRATVVHIRSPAPTERSLTCEVRVSTSEEAGWGVASGSGLTLGPRDRWAETDVTPLVSGRRSGGLSLIIRYWCTEDGLLGPLEMGGAGRRGRRGSIRRPFSSRSPLKVPALLLYLEEDMHPKDWLVPSGIPALLVSGRTRHRRSKEPGSIGSDIPNYIRKSIVATNQCKLHSYRVAFRDLGWDHWIIAPHTYNPRYCKGDCPRVLHYGYNAPNHAIVQNFINEIMAGEVPPPSCVPYKYKPISVLMMEKNGSVTYKEYEDMIAESCTCR
ncbi:bone morphogenetic protein 15-like [Scleropages formosus]|uniref:Bone morphogenetic protein 15-like n=1 Tax=Scleropages formosus TaxID=113540 RepID=A0A0P7ULE7_SCLFO|nr:bone morphogenetic protein 15-like [Scleropages formosus]